MWARSFSRVGLSVVAFNYVSMSRKYRRLTGDSDPEFFSLVGVQKNCTKVAVSYDRPESEFAKMRDWCEEHCGDNWIYNFNVFYFKDPDIATLFALRWC